MSVIADREYAFEEVRMDDAEYIGCRFTNCTLLYGGGDIPRSQNCTFNDCYWYLDGAAARTFQFIRGLGDPSNTGGRDMVEMFVEMLRTPLDDPPLRGPDAQEDNG